MGTTVTNTICLHRMYIMYRAAVYTQHSHNSRAPRCRTPTQPWSSHVWDQTCEALHVPRRGFRARMWSSHGWHESDAARMSLRHSRVRVYTEPWLHCRIPSDHLVESHLSTIVLPRCTRLYASLHRAITSSGPHLQHRVTGSCSLTNVLYTRINEPRLD